MMQFLPLLLLLLTTGERVAAWDNNMDQDLNRDCPTGQAISYISSYHHNGAEDRSFTVKCRAAVPFSECYWTGYVNNFDRPVDFKCRDNFVITGISSKHNNRDEDRRWKFHCCKSPQLETHGCQQTYWVNDWDQYFYWHVPGGNYLTGMSSVHDNGYEDRRFRFTYCQGRKRTR